MSVLISVFLSLFFFVCPFLEGSTSAAVVNSEAMQGIPVAFQGRFREIKAYSSLWLHDIYHAPQIRKQDRGELKTSTAEDLLWNFHFFGHSSYSEAPLFWIQNSDLKELLSLSVSSNRFSYQELAAGIERPSFLKQIAALEYSRLYYNGMNRSQSKKLELKTLSPDLWLSVNQAGIVVLSRGSTKPWNTLPVGDLTPPPAELSSKNKLLLDNALALLQQLRSFENIKSGSLSQDTKLTAALTAWREQGLTSKEISLLAAEQFPLRSRLQQSGFLLQVLPGKLSNGEWYSLNALKVQEYDPTNNSLRPADNFTLYDDSIFTKLRSTYLALEKAVLHEEKLAAQELSLQLGALLREGYSSIAGTLLHKSGNKELYYPTTTQLTWERFYYRYPLIEICLFFYIASLCAFLIALRVQGKKMEACAFLLLATAFLVHTFIIVLRCYILSRPPVSNMFETVIYVPWIAVLFSFILRPYIKTSLLFIGSSMVAILLLVMLKVSNLNHSMENVQAVLDSQYWLVVHVMMIVASYGIFALSGVLAHIYVIGFLLVKKETPWLKYVAACILQTLYIGILLLIPGTILGGVWAAQSWGRFWDWDPKESWAFISSCVYLIGVHAHRFGFVSHFGLSIGAIIGLLTISFTWYGVNYLLGTGLHSYGFGSGGDLYYYLYLLTETLFITSATAAKIIFLRRKGLYAITK